MPLDAQHEAPVGAFDALGHAIVGVGGEDQALAQLAHAAVVRGVDLVASTAAVGTPKKAPLVDLDGVRGLFT